MKKYKESFHDKIGAKNIDPYDVFLLQYILSGEKEKLATLVHLLLHKKDIKERIRIHNLIMFDEMKMDKRGDEGRALEFLEFPLLNKNYGEKNNLLFDAAERLRKNGGKPSKASTKIVEEVYQAKEEEEITGGEVLLPVRSDGVVDATKMYFQSVSKSMISSSSSVSDSSSSLNMLCIMFFALEIAPPSI
eukprot:Tbor_TRINITY_DN6066_c0_g1::TRINITY_DN6066_c0_g1_i4::g.11027::m.11027